MPSRMRNEAANVQNRVWLVFVKVERVRRAKTKSEIKRLKLKQNNDLGGARRAARDLLGRGRRASLHIRRTIALVQQQQRQELPREQGRREGLGSRCIGVCGVCGVGMCR